MSGDKSQRSLLCMVIVCGGSALFKCSENSSIALKRIVVSDVDRDAVRLSSCCSVSFSAESVSSSAVGWRCE